MTPSMEQVLAPLCVPARRCQLSLWLHRGKRGHWRGAGGCPVPSPPRAARLGSGSPAERWWQQRPAPPQPLPPSLYPRNLLLPKRLQRQSPAQAAWRGVPGGWWGSINRKQHGEGVGDQRKPGEMENGSRSLKEGQRWGPSEGEEDSGGDPAAPRRGWEKCLSLQGEGWGPLPGDPWVVPSSDGPAGQTPTHPTGL